MHCPRNQDLKSVIVSQAFHIKTLRTRPCTTHISNQKNAFPNLLKVRIGFIESPFSFAVSGIPRKTLVVVPFSKVFEDRKGPPSITWIRVGHRAIYVYYEQSKYTSSIKVI
jgi:hypothetical protein